MPSTQAGENIPMTFPMPGFLREVLDDRLAFVGEVIHDQEAKHRLADGVEAGSVLSIDVDDYDRLVKAYELKGSITLMVKLDDEARAQT